MALVLMALLLQTASCDAVLGQARARVWALDIPGALAVLLSAPGKECDQAQIQRVYLQGWLAARDAYRTGGSDESLAPVRKAVAALEGWAAGGHATAEIAHLVLLAAASAAQSERGEMAILLEHAADLETRQRARSGAVLLPLTALEAAGDLWLQVHRFDTARQAYQASAAVGGTTPRGAVGLARAAVRLKDERLACESYRVLTLALSARAGDSPELREATAYLDQHGCPR